MATTYAYSIGQMVIANKNAHHELVGMFGTIVERVDGTYGVELDHSFDVYLHDCNGKATTRWGWYFKPEEIEEYNQSYECRTSVRDKEILKNIRENTNTCIDEKDYSVKINGAIISVYEGARRFAIISNGSLVKLDVNSIGDELYLNHVLDAFKVEEGKGIYQGSLVAMTKDNTPIEASLEVKVEPIQSEKVVKKTTKKVAEKVKEKSEEPKIYNSEEEMLADLGIVK